MVIKYKIRGTDWLTFPLIIVNFNHFFIQLTPGRFCNSISLLKMYSISCIIVMIIYFTLLLDYLRYKGNDRP